MNHKIYDADRHVIEPSNIWTDYLDKTVFQQCPVYLKYDTPAAAADRLKRLGAPSAIELPPQYMIGPHMLMANWPEEIQVASTRVSNGTRAERNMAVSGEGQLASMDESGVKHASLFPTFTPLVVNHKDVSAEVSLAYAEAYNYWLKDYCSVDTSRLLAVGLISRHEPKNMISQLEKVVSYGWSCITLRPEVIAGRIIGHRDYEEFWQACEHYNVAVAFHGSTHLHGPTAGTERFSSRFSLHACSHPMEAQMAFLSLLDSGVLERYPKLKFAFLEAGASWLPHWLWRLDNICYPDFQELTKTNIKMLPSEYFKRNCWVSIELEEPCLRQTIETVGIECLLFGTDFPHPDHLRFDISQFLCDESNYSEKEREKLLLSNSLEFFSPISAGED